MPKEDRMPQDDRLIYLVFTAQQKLRTYLKNALLAEGVKVTPTQTGILFLLKHKDGRTMTELSQILCADNSTMTGLVDRLEKSGFVVRESSPTDRRALLIRITEEGIDEIDRAKAIIKRVNEEIGSGFSEEEITDFKKVLDSFFQKFNVAESAALRKVAP
jgi:DNA-binding MarR family transcriptional regulator